MPYIKPDSERGPIGAWLRRSREDRNWSVAEVVERLRDDHDVVIREDYYRQLEAGPNRVPSPPLMQAFIDLFESAPDWEAPLRGMHRKEALRSSANAWLTPLMIEGRGTVTPTDEQLTDYLAAVNEKLDSLLAEVKRLNDTKDRQQRQVVLSADDLRRLVTDPRT